VLRVGERVRAWTGAGLRTITAIMKVLIAGESWVTHSTHVKGVDSFTTSVFEEGVTPLRAALVDRGHQVSWLPGHEVPTSFPSVVADLAGTDVVILSDIGANSLLLAPQTFARSEPAPDRLVLLRDWVGGGGGLIMVGGYLSFAGVDGKARYGDTAVEECLPVTIAPLDDRVETPDGATGEVVDAAHPLVAGIAGDWPVLLGYNRVVARPEADLVATVRGDPLVAGWRFGDGRSAVFTSDCSPHWAPPPFVAWEHYAQLWDNLVTWVGAAG
jgi:uncharacterized membrane protein